MEYTKGETGHGHTSRAGGKGQIGMRVGWGTGCITPEGCVVIAGQAPFRPASVVHDDIFATAMVLQSGDTRVIWVSCDICHPTAHLRETAAAMLAAEIPGFREEEFVLNTTHATACFWLTDREFLMSGYRMPYDKIEPMEKTREHVCRGIVAAVKEALTHMEDCRAEAASADILTGFCRRVVFADGSAAMYGDVHRPDFRRMEYPDGGPSQFLYFRRCADGKLTGILANVPCPSQADESSLHITSDYWGTVRRRIREAYGEDVRVLTTCRAAGELSPHRLMRSPDHNRMEEWGPQAAERLGNLVADGILAAEKDVKLTIPADADVRMLNREVDFPVRQTNAEEYAEALAYFADRDNFDENGIEKDWMRQAKYAHVRFLWERKPQTYRARISAVKLGDAVLYTAPAELFAEYTARITVRFRERALFDVQLAQDCMGYLPTKEAIEHGGYSALIFNNVTDDRGGELYVEEATALIRQLEVSV